MVTVISEKLTINGVGAEVVFDGFDFTGNGYVEVKNASSVVIKNCRVYDMNVESTAKNYWLKIYNDIPVKLIVENNFFGDNLGTAGSMYNLIEPNAKLMSGSSISDNYFTAGCCAHNVINVYGCADDAIINVNGNVIEMTAGGVRIGVKGEPVCHINVRDNKVLAENPAYSDIYQGLVTVQPYGKATTSFANMTVAMSGNELPCEQIIYAYYGAQDTKMDENTIPKVIIDGKNFNLPIIH